MTDTTYNGWTNYETWCVNLWIDNDEGLRDSVVELAREAAENPEPNCFAAGGYLSPAYTLQKQIQAAMEEGMPDLGASMWADLLGAAFDSVSWNEIAEHFLADLPADDLPEFLQPTHDDAMAHHALHGGPTSRK